MGRGGGCVPGKLTLPGKKSKKPDADGGTTMGMASNEGEPMQTDGTAAMGRNEHMSEHGAEPASATTTMSAHRRNEHMSEHGAEPASATTTMSASKEKLKIYVVYYSTYGHVAAMAEKVKAGVDSVEGVEGILYQVPETLSEDVLSQMKAPPKHSKVPVISAAELVEADAIIFGFPTRYGAMAAQMKAFFDSTGYLWREGRLAGKPAGFFVSTGTQGGGQETTAWTAISQLTHHGMLFVPIGYTFGAGMFKLDEIRGGSAYGAGTFAGDGTRSPSETELALAQHQGSYTADIVKRLSRTSS